jgi:hypothetical protein
MLGMPTGASFCCSHRAAGRRHIEGHRQAEIPFGPSQKAICGGMMIGLTGTGNPGTAVVPMAFQSALAGLGLAADLVKHAAGLPVPASTSTRVCPIAEASRPRSRRT